jgi:hypothetical protein
MRSHDVLAGLDTAVELTVMWFQFPTKSLQLLHYCVPLRRALNKNHTNFALCITELQKGHDKARAMRCPVVHGFKIVILFGKDTIHLPSRIERSL